jgi:hypothetical protein
LVFELGHKLGIAARGYDFSVHALAGLLVAIGVAKALLHIFFNDSAEIRAGVLTGVTAGFVGGLLGGLCGYATDPTYKLSFAYRLSVLLAAATPTGGLIGAASTWAGSDLRDWRKELSVICSSVIVMAAMAGFLLSADLPSVDDKSVEFGHLLLVFEWFLPSYLVLDGLAKTWSMIRILIALTGAGAFSAIANFASFWRIIQDDQAVTIYHMQFFDTPEGHTQFVLSIGALICWTVVAYAVSAKWSRISEVKVREMFR